MLIAINSLTQRSLFSMKQTLTLANLAATNILVTLLFQWYVITQVGVGIERDALFAGIACS